jgi:single-strand DNA-binding protein
VDVSTVTVLGNVAAEPRISGGIDEPDRVTFRVIANQRRFDRQTSAWVEAGEYSVNVVCWRSLARGVAGSVHMGDPVLVVGRINERQYELDGAKRYTTEVTATYVGHDLSKGRASFRRFRRDNAGATVPGVAGGDGDGADQVAGADDQGSGDNGLTSRESVDGRDNGSAHVGTVPGESAFDDELSTELAGV